MPGREGESKRDKEAERDKAGGELSWAGFSVCHNVKEKPRTFLTVSFNRWYWLYSHSIIKKCKKISAFPENSDYKFWKVGLSDWALDISLLALAQNVRH